MCMNILYMYIYIHICSWNSMWIQHNFPRPLPKCTAGRWCAAFQLRVVSFCTWCVCLTSFGMATIITCN